MEIIRDMRIYTNDDVILVEDIHIYEIYNTNNTLKIVTESDRVLRYDLKQITQIDISIRLNGKNYADFTDTILF